MDISLDQYNTRIEVAKFCFHKTKEIIGSDNITQYLEPSAGRGIFLPLFDKPFKAYDLEPTNDFITKADYLQLNLDYKKGRCIIGNPPFGKDNKLSVKFFKQAIKQADYISFILPISQLNNNSTMYEFDLIYSSDLSIRRYSNKYIHCCLNIYKRNANGLNKKKSTTIKLDYIKLKVVSRNTKYTYSIPEKYDFSICSFGTIGKICDREDQYSQQIYFTIDPQYKDRVLELIKVADWKKIYNINGVPSLKQWQILKYLEENIS